MNELVKRRDLFNSQLLYHKDEFDYKKCGAEVKKKVVYKKEEKQSHNQNGRKS